MISNQISLLENELITLASKINNVTGKNTENIDELTNKYYTIKKTLATYRVQEFEEREYLDFDDDLR